MNLYIALLGSGLFGGFWFSFFYFGPGIYNYLKLRRSNK